MQIINNRRIIDVNCFSDNKQTYDLGYTSDAYSIQLNLLFPDEYKGEGFSYKIVFDKEDGTEVLTYPIIGSQGKYYALILPAVSRGTNGIGYKGHFQFFVLRGDGNNTKLVAASEKFPYIIKDGLPTDIDPAQPGSAIGWTELDEAVMKINNSDFIEVVNLGTISTTTAFDSVEYCTELIKYVFSMSDNVRYFYGLPSNIDLVCELIYDDHLQIITAYATDVNTNVGYKYERIRTVRSSYPNFTADSWHAPRLNGNDIHENTISFQKLNQSLRERIETDENNLAALSSLDMILHIDLGTLSQVSDLNNINYCTELVKYTFIPDQNIRTHLHFPPSGTIVCEMNYNNGFQTIDAYMDGRKFTRVRPVYSISPQSPSFGSWDYAKISGTEIYINAIDFNQLSGQLQQRITTDESNISNKADYFTVNAIFATDGKLLDVSRDSTLPSVNSNAVYAYLDKSVTTISRSTLLTYYPNLTTVYVDNDETDITITGTGELTFVFKGDFNAGRLLLIGISKAINDTNTRLATLENTVGTVNSILQGIVDGGSSNA